MKKRHLLHVLAASVALVAAPALLSACSPDKPNFHAIDLTGADYAKDFDLTDQNGKERTLKDYRGKVVAVFFGYVHCPDFCPTTMAELAQVKQQLGKDGDKLQALFVTVDPERDTPELLKAYVGNFDPGFVALRGTPEQTAQLAKDFKIYYKKVEGKTPGNYTMDHSAGTYFYDPQGRLRLYSRYGSGVPALVSDIELLLKSSG